MRRIRCQKPEEQVVLWARDRLRTDDTHATVWNACGFDLAPSGSRRFPERMVRKALFVEYAVAEFPERIGVVRHESRESNDVVSFSNRTITQWALHAGNNDGHAITAPLSKIGSA